MWQIFLDVCCTLLRWDFYLGAAFGTALFLYIWYQEVRIDGNRWPLFATGAESLVLCIMCFVPILNLVGMLLGLFLVTMMWNTAPPSQRRSI
jgi:hypothetical protein